MSHTFLVDGNAVAYTLNIDNYNNEKDFAKAYFNKLRDLSKTFMSMPKMLLFFDNKSGLTWRDKLYPDYQKDRRLQKEKFTEKQKLEAYKRSSYIKYIKDSIDKNAKFSYISYPHTETDDLVSLYCNNIQEDGETVIILTTDKDLYQLIREKGNRKVQILFLIKRKVIKSEQEGKDILEKKIMLGDPSDSIPSVCKGVGPKYYPDFKVFLKTMKENSIDPTNKEEAKKLCEKLNIKYISSFSNFDKEQLYLNKKLVDLNTVCENDKKADFEKTKYLKDIIKTAKFSPYSMFTLKFD